MAEYRDPNPIDPNRLYNIDELAEFIRSKIYGRDVRESIALAIEKIKSNVDGEGINSIIERGKNLYNKHDLNIGYVVNINNGELIRSESGNSSSNFIPVEPNQNYHKRIGGTPSQNAYYDINKEFISGDEGQGFKTPANCYFVIINIGQSSLETQQLEKGTSFTGYEEFGYRFKYELPLNGEDVVSTFNIKDGSITNEKLARGSVSNDKIPDETISYNKTDFVVTGKNKFNPHDTLAGYVVNAGTGNITPSSAGNSVSGFIYVEEDFDYIKNFNVPSQVAFYDINQEFMSGVESMSFRTPVGCRYIRINYRESEKGTTQLEEGTATTSLEPFGYQFKYQSAPVVSGGLGIRFSLADNTSAAERVDGINSHSELDQTYPFNSIKLCNVQKTEWGATLVTYADEDGFARDGSNGEVMVEIPKIYFKRYRESGYEYIFVSGRPLDGYQVDPAFIENGKELNAIYVGVYDGYVSDDKLHSRSGVYPTRDLSLTELRTFAQNNGEGFGEIDFRTIALLQRMFMVYFANRDSQASVGAGFTQMHYQTFATCVARNTATASNYIEIDPRSRDYRHFLVGDTVTVSDDYWLSENRKITNIVNVGALKGITFEGDPVDIIEGTTRIYHTPQINGQTDSMTEHSGSANIFGVEGHDAVKLFHIENLWGNVWTLLDGVILDNLVAYVGENMSDYTSDDSFKSTYKPLSMMFPEQTSNVQDRDTEFEFFIKNLAYDKIHPAYQLPLELGTGGSTSNFSDPWYSHDRPAQIPSYGGGWDLWFRAGIFSTRFWYGANQPHNLNGGRLIYKPVNK